MDVWFDLRCGKLHYNPDGSRFEQVKRHHLVRLSTDEVKDIDSIQMELHYLLDQAFKEVFLQLKK